MFLINDYTNYNNSNLIATKPSLLSLKLYFTQRNSDLTTMNLVDQAHINFMHLVFTVSNFFNFLKQNYKCLKLMIPIFVNLIGNH